MIITLRRIIVSGSLLLSSFCTSAQTDTIRIMGYNLLFYGNSANPYTYKDPRLSSILQHVQPDIFGANEISSGAANSQNILNNVLGNGWSKGSYINTNNEVQTNMLFWKTAKFGLKSEQSICSNLRDIIAYKLYFKDTISIPHDTVYMTVIVGHLKASQGTQEEAARAAEAQAVVNYLNSLGQQGNYIMMGDLNVYTSTEQAYQKLVNSPNPFSKLYDPINTPGDWNNDVTFANIHTQATRTSQLPDGGVDGGLDDRFDFQLVSNYIMTDAKGVKYIPNTYRTLGQDGQHFNDALIDLPTNTSAPANIIQALYQMSDHLPVYADYKVHAHSPAGVINTNNTTYTTTVVNPIANNKLSVIFDEKLRGENVRVEIYSVQGSLLFSKASTIHSGDLNRSYDVSHLSTGIYFLRMSSANGYSYYTKVANN